MAQSDDRFTILLIADNFDPHFAPITCNTPWAKWHLASIKLLDIALDWISLLNTPNVPNILIVSATLSEEDLAEFSKKWACNFKSFRAVRCQNCMSVGQIMREVESRSLLSDGEFLLIENLATFCSSNLASQIETFRNRRKKDKNCVMSLLYSRQISGEQRFVGFEADSKKLFLYHGTKDSPTTDYNKKMFTTSSVIRSDLAPCGIAICSREIMIQFADNIDFEQFDEVIHEILGNEDVLCQTINVELLPEDVVAFTACDYGSLLRAQRLLVHRWCFPLSYDRLPTRVFEDHIPLRYHRNHVYIPRDEEGPPDAEGTVLGRGNNIDKDTMVQDATMGRNATIKEGAAVRSVIAGHNFTVGSNSVIDGAIIGDNVTIGSNCKIREKTVIGSNVVIPNNKVIASYSAVMATAAPEDNDDLASKKDAGYYFWSLLDEANGYFWRRSQSYSRVRHERHASTQSRSSLQHSVSVNEHSGMDQDVAEPSQGDADVILHTEHYYTIFMREISESMRDTYESENRATSDAMSSLKIEINGSRLSNNISHEDCVRGIFTAFLSLPPFENTQQVALIQQLFQEWNELWSNYYRTRDNKLQILHAIEDAALSNQTIRLLMPHIIKCVYDNLDNFDEEIILSWHDGLPEDSILRPIMKQLVDWLMEDEDEETEDDEEDA